MDIYGEQQTAVAANTAADVNLDAELLAEIQRVEESFSQNPTPATEDVQSVAPTEVTPSGDIEDSETIRTSDGKVINLSYSQLEELVEYATTLENEKNTWDIERREKEIKEQSLLNQVEKLSSLIQEKDEKLLDPRRKTLDDNLSELAYYYEEFNKNPNDKVVGNRLLNKSKSLVESITGKPLDWYLEEYWSGQVRNLPSDTDGGMVSDIPEPSRKEQPNMMDKFIQFGSSR